MIEEKWMRNKYGEEKRMRNEYDRREVDEK